MFKHSANLTQNNGLTPLNPSPEPTPPSTKSVLIWALIVLGLLVVFLVARYFVLSKDTSYGTLLHPKRISFFETVHNLIFRTGSVLQGQTDDRINILLLGVGGPGHDGPFLSDTNIIVSIKPSTNEVALISIPRDLGAKVDDHGWRKINSADAFGEAENPGNGGDYARQIFEQTFKISIPYYIRVDFNAFSELINEVGGITVVVPKSFTDTSFPIDATFGYTTVHFDAGHQTMTGEQALTYARSRHGDNGEGSDFARARRQQIVLEALKSRLLTLGTYNNPTILQSMYNSLSAHIATNLNLGELAYLATIAKNINTTKNLVFDSSPTGYLVNTTGDNGAFILWPKTGNFDTINTAIQTVFTATNTQALSIAPPTIAITSKNASTSLFAPTRIEIKNGTWIPGLAARMEKKWDDAGLTVTSVGNSLKRPIEKTLVFTINPKADAKVLAYILKELRTTSSTILPDWLQENYDNITTPEDETGMKYNRDSDILVILGTDTQK
jgi:LCP family protein required for cell wall assembly